jgi:hypothetical protein
MMSTMLTPPPSATLSSWTRKSDRTSSNCSPQTPVSTFEKVVEKKLLPGAVYYGNNNSVGKYHSFNEQYYIPVEDKIIQLPIQYAQPIYRQPVIHIIPNSNLGYFADNPVILSSPSPLIDDIILYNFF